jgi:uncharacterized protein YprB with RNaseH-like and TPR domain
MESGPAFSAVGREWRSRIEGSHDYAVIRNDTVFRTSFHDSWVWESQHEAANEQLARLMEIHEGMTLDELFHGSACETYEGECYCIRSEEQLGVQDCDRKRIHDELSCDLTLVYGIGRKKERELKERGFRTIADLTHHRRFGRAAAETLRILSGHPSSIVSLVSRWHSPSHQLAFRTSGLYGKRDLLFIDLETLGFFSRPIILFGLAEVGDDLLRISQYLLRSIDEELPALSAVHDTLHEERVIVSFNGKTFDIPYLMERSAYYGRPVSIANPHYDLLHFSRRQWKNRFPDCRLVTLERNLFGIDRNDDIPSAMVPEFYEAFLTSGNPGPLVPIITHNRQDLVSLARLFCLMQEGVPA